MAVRVRLYCELCHALPDPVTQRALEGQLLHRAFGQYLDAQPGGWLIWTGGGPLGSKRYACAEHRQALIEVLRKHHGAVRRCGVWKDEPYPALWPDGLRGLDEHELAELLEGGRRSAREHAS